MEKILESWLVDFKPKTAKTYLYALKRFKKELDIEDLDEYMAGEPDAFGDFKRFAQALEGRPKKTIMTYIGAVKVFFQDHKMKFPEEELTKFRRRGGIPKRARATTKDKAPTKPQMRSILNYMEVKGRAVTLFLASSGCRIGAALQVQLSDLDLDADPPSSRIRDEYTKGGESGRKVYFSYEARDAIVDWLRARDSMGKRTGEGETYESHLLFPFGANNARGMWNRACDKAGMAQRDVVTDRRIYHLHGLRKFFRSNIGLKTDYTHGLMGHLQYLDDSYLREEQGEVAQAYKENMDRVSFFGLESGELKRTVEVLEAELTELRDSVKRFVGRSPEEVDRMVSWWEQHKMGVEVQKAQEADYKLLNGKHDDLFEPAPTQRVIPEDELEHWLSLGWEYVNSLNNGSHKCVVKAPGD